MTMRKMKKVFILFLILVLSSNFVFASVDSSLLDIALEKLLKAKEGDRVFVYDLLGEYIYTNTGIEEFKRDLPMYLKQLGPEYEEKLEESKYTMEDLKEQLNIFKILNKTDKDSFRQAILDQDQATIRRILKNKNENNNGNGIISNPGDTPSIGGNESSNVPKDKEDDKPNKPSDKPENKETKFLDIKGHRYRDEIIRLTNGDVIKGRTETKFDPDGEITRAEFVVLIDRILELEEKNAKLPFVDVKEKDWYYSSVRKAYNNKVINGKTLKKFEPNSKITREEMETIVMRVLKKDNKIANIAKTDKNILAYEDHINISKWAEKNVKESVEYGILEDRDKKLAPKKFATRAEAAKALDKVFEAAKKQ